MGLLRPSICRVCANGCGILAETEGGQLIRVTGDRDNPLYKGYTCVKGRALPALLNDPGRLLHSMKRLADGSFQAIPSEQAMDEIAERLTVILGEHGPGSIAGYLGTMISLAVSSMYTAFMNAIGSPMRFGTATIDQPGKILAKAMHGMWMAPARAFDLPEVALIVGANPLISHEGFPMGNPGAFLASSLRRGMKLIVIDPRRSDTAKRASLHLQPRPGEDIPILAALLRVILEERLYDHEFVTENVLGLETLRRSIEPFTPNEVARRADLSAEALVEASRIFGRSSRGYALAGTGPSMSSARSTLVEYLILCLDTLCGHWPRAGELVRSAATLLPQIPAKAQALPPWSPYGDGTALRIRGLKETMAGMPTAALAEEILLDGPGQVKALISISGNPVAAWPDQLKVIEALKELELLVQIDVKMSATARFAHYIIAPKMGLEMAGTTQFNDIFGCVSSGLGFAESYAQYTPSIVDPPKGSDLIEEWEFFYGLGQRLGLELEIPSIGSEFGISESGDDKLRFDMTRTPSTDELLEIMTRGSRISLEEVKTRPHGDFFPTPAVFVEPRDAGWSGRLNVGSADMMTDLAEVARQPSGEELDPYPFRLISRRLMHVHNSSLRNIPGVKGRRYNPAFLHPDDLSDLKLKSGDHVEIRSERAAISAIVEADDTLRRGIISMTHCFGEAPDRDGDVDEIGSPTSRLCRADREWERYSGQPRMSNIPVQIQMVNSRQRRH